MDYSFLEGNYLVPVVQISDPSETVDKLSALYEGGIRIAEITFRSDKAIEVLKIAVHDFGNKMMIGAGTVVSREQAIDALKIGAKFLVSPCFTEEVYAISQFKNVPYIPGVVTPNEVAKMRSLGLTVLKFFPAEDFGGARTLKALHSVFPEIKFMPTGGINELNIKDYLNLDYVIAIGGSFMMKGEPEDIQKQTAKAVKAIKEYKEAKQ